MHLFLRLTVSDSLLTKEGGEEPSSEQQDLPRSMSDPEYVRVMSVTQARFEKCDSVKQPTLWKSAKQESPVEERDHLNIDDEGADWLESNLRETSEKNGTVGIFGLNRFMVMVSFQGDKSILPLSAAPKRKAFS